MSKTKVMSDQLMRELMTTHLQALSVIEDNQEVERVRKVPEGWEVHIAKAKDD